jgi:transcriptional regulator with XRE-family HTH domain
MHKVRNEEVMMLFGKNVSKIRNDKGITQEELAEEAKISQVQVARIESGRLNTSISTLIAIATALGVNAGDLFRKED